jgi:hypothetical protein
MKVLQLLLMEKKQLLCKVCKGSVGRELYFRLTSDDSYNAELQSECCIALKIVHHISNYCCTIKSYRLLRPLSHYKLLAITTWVH